MESVIRSTLLEGLFGRQQAAVLTVLLSRPAARLYQRQVAELAGLRLLQAQRALRSLAALGVLTEEPVGNRLYYTTNPSCPILPDLTAIVLKTAGLVEVLRSALAGTPGISLAFVYGSFARGQPTPRSDIDLLVVGSVSIEDLAPALHRAEHTLAREVNPTIYTPAELRAKAAEGHYFIAAVLREAKLYVIGDADVLGRLVAGSQDNAARSQQPGDPPAVGAGRP